MPSLRRRATQQDPSVNNASTSTQSVSRGQSIPVVNLHQARGKARKGRRLSADLEKRKQIRYLAQHHPEINHKQAAKVVGCAMSAVSKILANTYGGGDPDPDALPEDAAFLRNYGVGVDNNQGEVLVPYWNPNDLSDDDQPIRPRRERSVSLEIENDIVVMEPRPSPPPNDQLRNSPMTSEKDIEWVGKFFNEIGTLNLPNPVIAEMIAAGFKEYTVLYLRRTYTHKLELANYLATVLRVAPMERDAIAHFIIERRNDIGVFKRERFD